MQSFYSHKCKHFIVKCVFFLCMQICKQLFDHIMKNIHICDHKPNCGLYATDKLAYFLQMQTSFGCIFAPKFSIVQSFYKSMMDTLVVSIPSIGEQEGFILCWKRENPEYWDWPNLFLVETLVVGGGYLDSMPGAETRRKSLAKQYCRWSRCNPLLTSAAKPPQSVRRWISGLWVLPPDSSLLALSLLRTLFRKL